MVLLHASQDWNGSQLAFLHCVYTLPGIHKYIICYYLLEFIHAPRLYFPATQSATYCIWFSPLLIQIDTGSRSCCHGFLFWFFPRIFAATYTIGYWQTKGCQGFSFWFFPAPVLSLLWFLGVRTAIFYWFTTLVFIVPLVSRFRFWFFLCFIISFDSVFASTYRATHWYWYIH